MLEDKKMEDRIVKEGDKKNDQIKTWFTFMVNVALMPRSLSLSLSSNNNN